MQGRSWMAALTLNACAVLGLVLGNGMPTASRAGEPQPEPARAPGTSQAPSTSAVLLKLDIAGLGEKGCDVEIVPGYMGSQFQSKRFHLKQNDANKGQILFEDIHTTSDDRYCLFAITIREPGQPVRTVRRGLRLVPSSTSSVSPQMLVCYLNSPSKLAKAPEMRERR